MSGVRSDATASRQDGAAWVVALVASAGGLTALTSVLRSLPADFPAAVIVLQHLSARHPSHLVQALRSSSPLPIREALDGDRLQRGHVYVAPRDRHLVITAGGRLALTDTLPVHFVRPSADVLLESLAEAFGTHAVAVILSGRGQDGADGAVAVRSAGGVVFAEDAATAGYFNMPAAAIETGRVNRVLRVEQIGPALEQLVEVEVDHEHT